MTTADANPTTAGRITTAEATTITEHTPTTNAGEIAANTTMAQIATTISVIATAAETVNDTDAFDTTSSFASTGMTASHEPTTNAASLESASESLTTAVDLYTSDYFTTVASFSAMVRIVEEDEASATYTARTANPIHTDMKRTTTAEATTITERSITNAGETTANGKMDEATRVVAQTAETV